MSPRWYDQRTGDHLALDTGGGPIARLCATALANKVGTEVDTGGYVKATGNTVIINIPKTAMRRRRLNGMAEAVDHGIRGLDLV